MKKTLTFFCFQILLLSSFSQNETKKWFFGFYESIDFMTNPPTPSSALSQMGSMSACASIADAAGNLLFYSNGINIWNASHFPMANSNSLIPTGVTVQSTIILKKPGLSNQYFVFSQSASNSTIHGLYYAIVDMNLASGQGSVVVKSQLLDSTPSNGKLAATTHCNGIDIWLLKHDLNSNLFKAHLLSSSGISTSPVITAIAQQGLMANIGQMKFSPNGKKIAYPASTNLEVYDFDKSNGLVSNSLNLNSNMMGYVACDFSNDGSVLYACANHVLPGNTPDEIDQWNLCAGTAIQILASKKTIDTLQGAYHRSMQLAPNGKIYISSGSDNLSVINNPNALGPACNYSNTAFNFNWPNTIMSLPSFNSTYFNPFPSSPTYSMFTQVLCQTVSFSCAIVNSIPGCVASGNSPNSALWNFGEASAGPLNYSNSLNPKHIYAMPGTYTAQAIITHDCKTDTLNTVIHIAAYNPNITISGRDTICQKEWLILSASGANSYTWSTGATTQTMVVMPQFQFTYAVVGTNTNNNCTSEKTFTANVNICETLNELQSPFSLNIFPNPAKTQLTILFDNSNKNNTQLVQIKLTDVIGRLIEEKYLQTNQSLVLDLSGCSEGIYNISIYQNKMIVCSKKIVIDKN